MAGPKLGVTGLSLHDDKLWGFYRAKVLDVADPLQLGRIKAEVMPYFVGIDTDIIPWAVPKNPMIEGAGSGVGTFAVPEVGSMVWVFFEMGDVYQPVYDGEAPDAVHGLPSDRTTNYPTRKVIKTSCGITYITDDTAQQSIIYTAGGIVSTIDDAASTVTLHHPTGTEITVGPGGEVTINSVSTVTIIGQQVRINPI